MGHNAHPHPSKVRLKGLPPIPAGPYVCEAGHDVHDHDVSRGIGGRLVALCWTCRREGTSVEPGAGKRRTFAARHVPVLPKANYRPAAKVKPTPQAVPEAMFSDEEVPRGFLDEHNRIEVTRDDRGRRAKR